MNFSGGASGAFIMLKVASPTDFFTVEALLAAPGHPDAIGVTTPRPYPTS
jgi:hypothetical protein